MNIKIAERLLEYRRVNGYSQEALAEKIGVSRQAVSKWERAESSPDTDNLIALAGLYGVTIDEMINGASEPCARQSQEQCGNGENDGQDGDKSAQDQMGDGKTDDDKISHDSTAESRKGDYVHIGSDGIHVEDKEGSKVHISFRNGIQVEDNNGGNVHIGNDGAVTGGPEHRSMGIWMSSTVPVIAIIAYLLMGFLTKWGWGVGWIVFLLIPVIYSVDAVIRTKKFSRFNYPMLVTAVYLFIGMMYDMWHPYWILFLTIPVFYSVCTAFEHGKRK